VNCYTPFTIYLPTCISFTFLVPAHPGSPGKRAVKWACVFTCIDHKKLQVEQSVYLW